MLYEVITQSTGYVVKETLLLPGRLITGAVDAAAHATDQLDAYFAGELRRFDVPLD